MKNENNKKENKILKYFSRNKHNILVIIMILVIILSVVTYKKYLNEKVTYTVVNGYVEKTTESLAAILKNETIVDINTNEVAMPIVEENKRVSKGQTIAVYKNAQYDEYLKSLDEIDKQIQTLIVDLPNTYSTDVSAIDLEIAKLSKQALKETSYIKMQEYKSKIDELAYRKIIILGEHSPDGSKVRELIEQREQIEKNGNITSDTSNILATVSGIATYKIDGLEKEININDVLGYDAKKLDNIISKYQSNSTSNFGIKVVDNFHAYILIKEKISENDKYIKIGNKYEIRFNEKNKNNIVAELVKIEKDEEYNYTIFELNNEIEDLIDFRISNAEVVWEKVEGMAVPKVAIKTDEIGGYSYVTLVYGTQYVNVPIKIVLESDNICIVENLTNEEKEKIGVDTSFILEMYDKLVIE